MTNTVVKWLFLLAAFCFVHLDCEVYEDRPKIKTSDGDLILTPALDKNIYLLPNGPKSTIYVGNIDIKPQSTPGGFTYQPYNSENVDNNINSILARLEKLEDKKPELPVGLLQNITWLYRRVNNIHRKVLHLESLVNSRAKDECDSNPCEHGGTCLNLVGGYHCLCPSNWEGRDCDVDVNECRNFAGTDLGCQNGATCINRPGSYECLCKSGWFGLHCTRKAKDCSGGDSEMCGHGTCVQVTTGEGIQCLCHQGWTNNGTGVSCLTDINECESYQGPRCSVNPKVDCINLPGSFRCGQCPRGYEGDGYSCTDIDECLTIPNGGCSPLVTCHNTVGSRICGPCPPDYQGDGVTCTWRGSCNIAHGGCHPSAQCIEIPSPTGKTLQCICPEGMIGDGLGIGGCYVSTSSHSNSTEACENNPCGTHGQCHSLRTGYTCICYKGYGGAHCESQTSACAVNPCQNGGICRPDDTAIGGFRCECTAQYSGPLCQVRTKSCGGVLDHEEGSIVYPLTNTTYTHNSQCAWVIHTSPDKVINVTFSKFNLEGNDCAYDFLQIHDGRKSSSQLIGRFCGNNFPKGGNIVSSHNNLYFWFHSDSSVAKDGFALHWTSIKPVCGGEVNATTHGHISSPGSPGPYPPNRDCYWHLTTTLGKRISLHFYELDIESHINCSFDYLAIYDGEHLTDPLINKYCNSTQPAPVHSAGSDILIHFHSDAYSSGRGFQITYAPIEGVPGCGGYYTADKGEIVSPTYNGAYLSNLLCEYKIKTSAGTKIKITFISFKLERSFRCKYDYLKIYNGQSSDARVVGKFCGSTYPKTYTSTTNSLYMIFRTDRSMASDGFRITYEAICETTIVGDSGIIKSPGYPFSYPANKVCVYIIATVPGKAIQLTFQDFDIEDSKYYDCRFDNIEVRDGHDANSTLLGKYCGGAAHTPPVQTSTLNYMYIRFQSDLSLSGTGFYANYTTIDTECGGVYRETTGLINHPSGDESMYKNYQSCKWILIAPEGMHIKLTWNRFDIEDMVGCSSDYLKLVEIDDENNNQVSGTFCGSHSPPAFTTTTNRLMLQFVSDGSIRSSGFSVSYSFLDEKSHCGGTFIKTHGYIYSPGWPATYEPNRDCTWIINVPVGQQIKLNISQFNLERPMRNKCNLGDYLEIRNGGNENSPLIGQFCGEIKTKIILSLSNAMHLHFHSDFYLSGTGFKIEWDGTITGCGGTLTSPSGSISSPNYPSNYDENAECFYRIVTSAGSKLRISFTELDLERTPDCRDDYIEIYDGRSTSANSLGRHCFMSPDLSSIETSTNYAYIKFRSDVYMNAKGFMLNYQTICSNNVTGRYGVIESPGFPSNYPANLNCLWNIEVPKGNKINVTFIQFDVYQPTVFYRSHWTSPRHRFLFRDRSGEPCFADYLQTRELSAPNFSDRLCGNSLPQPISTKSNALQIKFTSSGFNTRPGFRLEWISYGCGGHIQKTQGIVSIDKSKTTESQMECEWLIETRPGKILTLTFTDLYMTDTHNCTTDAVEIYNGQNVKTPLLMKVCQNGHATLNTESNYALVRFVKQSQLKDVHFTLQFFSKNAKCGGFVRARTGLIYSKNYPQNYDNNVDCIWYISVPEYHRIELNFLDLDLYSVSHYDEDNCMDSIQIYDNNDYKVTSNYTYQICPNSNRTQIISKYNHIIVQFKTDEHGTAKGFKANFTMTCGAIINAKEQGYITSDSFVNNLNKSCIWTILAPSPDQKLYLMLTLLSLPKDSDVITNRNCPSSFLRVHDGDDERAPVIGEYCGRKVPPMIVSRGSALTIEFGSYTGKLAGKFSAHYSPLSNACGGTLESEEGTIASPNYPGPYPGSTDCEWIIKTSAGNTASIQFESFNLPYSENCNGDYVEIRDTDGAGRLLAVYCGSDMPTNHTVASQIYIKFHSISKSSGVGFLLHYGLQRENDIQGDSGEISSPLYPASYLGSGEYVWRVMTTGTDSISINIDKLQIYSPNDMNYNKLTIYDGFDITAPVLEEFNGVLSSTRLVLSSSSVVYITFNTDESNIGSSFHMSWSKTSTNLNREPQNLINCGGNHTESIEPGRVVNFNSPNYPNNYNENLNCEWVFKSQKGRHLAITFLDFEIEETSSCFADSVSIYSSDTPGNWKPVKENVCTSESVSNVTFASTNMKINFKSDSSMTRKGFRARVDSRCGGLLTDLSGLISPNWWDSMMPNNLYTSVTAKCEWTVKVRPGRTIQLSFTQFNITNNNDQCNTYVILRNGDSAEAPTLGSGKYCGYEHEKRIDITTSSNSLHVSYKRGVRVFETFTINYEEKNDECGSTSMLSPGHMSEIITSPNYPSIPAPYSECEWVFYGPPGEILRLDFKERFDLDSVEDCETEVVEIRDGSSKSSPSLGRLCGREQPGTVKSTSNAMYIKYLTQLKEPHNGFKANVTIDTCGGTIVTDSGEVTSLGYPHMHPLPAGTVCKWHVIGPATHIFLIKPQDVQLPQSETICSTRVTIEEVMPLNNSITVLKSMCSDDNMDLSAVETSSNNFTINLYIGKPDSWDKISESRGFRISFNSTRPMCGGFITTSEGYLSTPSYPQRTTIKQCHWIISVPNKSRKVRLEILDFDPSNHKILLYNDKMFQSAIQTIPSNEYIPGTTVFESTSNVLAIYMILNRTATSHRFKAKFTSDEAAVCGGELSGLSQEIISPTINQPYVCEWHYNNQVQTADYDAVSTNLTYNSIFVSINMSSSVSRTRCRVFNPKVSINTYIPKLRIKYWRDICGNTEATYVVPGPVIDVTAINTKLQSLHFHINLKSQPCGGVIHIGETPVNILNVPEFYNDTLECAWILAKPYNSWIELKMEGSFTLECDDEFVKVFQSFRAEAQEFGHYCKETFLEKPLISHFSQMFVQYHSSVKNKMNLRIMAKAVTNQCGGYLSAYQHTFTSPNYPKQYSSNQECSWEIRAREGYRVSLKFVDRFFIEEAANCTKDVVIIYDWSNDAYTEMARVCGRQTPPLYNSTHNRMKVVLRTDADINQDGFQATWNPICGGSYTAVEKEQILYSPGYPYYPSHIDCSYEISAPEKKVFLKFLDFELEGSFPTCDSDNLTISAQSDYRYFDQIYCGSEKPPVVGQFSKVSLRFKSDNYVQRRGFKISYSVYRCGGKVNNSTVLSSTLLDSYDENSNCTWFIEAPSNKVVVLKFLYIDLEGQDGCYNDYIAIYEGLKMDTDKRLALLCGRLNSTTTLRSKGNTMLLQFVSDSSISFTGFKVQVYFSYSEAAQCGGNINLSTSSPRVLKTPLMGQLVYESYLDCYWSVTSPPDTVIKVSFTSFHISPCENVNQTALGYSNCNCDLVEIRDGINPNSLVIGTYCGHSLPPVLTSSSNLLSIRLSTDGEIGSQGFEATLTAHPTLCGPSVIPVSHIPQRLKSPGFDTGAIPRGIHCTYSLDAHLEPYSLIRISVMTLDLRPAVKEGTNINHCNSDKLIISSQPPVPNITIGKDYVVNHQTDDFFNHMNFYETTVRYPNRFELCGLKMTTDIYVLGSVAVNIITTVESDSKTHKGVEIEVAYAGFCGRNYSEPYGRMQSTYPSQSDTTTIDDCYTLITAPENYTISAYFISSNPDYWDDECYLDIFDGNSTSAKRILKIHQDYNNRPVFSLGRYMLLHNHVHNYNRVGYDLNYIITNKGQGCGGKMHSEYGKITSPLYPNTYRRKASCEWELETPINTRLLLRFTDFDLGITCDQNYVQLVNSKNEVVRTFCSEFPADYTSDDYYVKVVFVTTQNNGGTGWTAEFIGILL
ncbi:unnamed protein product [Chrysodeixis includens]|uniref:Cubilin n=1 Tax=Chrysodeixis includens TaxID=689277 RepID=A0A9P0BXB6_CHRIL|nr:unnamed protein product [Chrysodeixis includens]